MRIERVVFDTNVLISSLLSALGPPRRCIDWARFNAVIVTSAPLVAEGKATAAKPRVARLLGGTGWELAIERLTREALVVSPAPIPPNCRDPKDDVVLATALAGRADAIVTGDVDLLILDPFEGIRVLTPTAFIEAVAEG